MRAEDEDRSGCCWTMLCCLPNVLGWLHQKGITPFSYHNAHSAADKSEMYPHRDQHFKATAIWTALLTFSAMAIFLDVEGFEHARDEESHWYEGLDDFYHQVATIVTFSAIALAAAGIFAGTYAGYRACNRTKELPAARERNVFDDEDHGDDVHLDERGGSATVTTAGGTPLDLMSEKSYLIDGKTGRGVSPCHPARSCVPMTPLKTFAWVTVIGGLGIGLTLAIKPDFYHDLSTTDFIHYGAEATAALTAGLVTAGLFTGAHWLGSKVHNCCNENGAEPYSDYAVLH